jgi:hypothetical protein
MIQQRGEFSFWAIIRDAAMVPGGVELWYGDPPHYLKLVGPPGTLAGNIMRLKNDLPRYNCDLEILGNDVHGTEKKPIVLKNISPSIQPTRKRSTTCCNARVLPTLYSC